MLDDTNTPWPTELVEALEELNQGDVVEDLPLGFYGNRDMAASKWTAQLPPEREGVQFVEPAERPKFWILTTQSCDLSEEGAPKRSYFLAAPVFKMDDLGERSRFEIEQLGVRYLFALTGDDFHDGYYLADLRIQIPFDKGILVNAKVHHGFANKWDRQRFSSRLAGLYDRPAFHKHISNNVVETLRQYFKKSQQRREDFAKCGVREIRIGVEGDPPSAIRLLVVVDNVDGKEGVRKLLAQWYTSTVTKLTPLGIEFQGISCNHLELLSAREYVSTEPIALEFLTPKTREIVPEAKDTHG